MVLFCRPQDYPSVYQLGELARTSETNIVFAVTSEGTNPNALRDVYQVTYYVYIYTVLLCCTKHKYTLPLVHNCTYTLHYHMKVLDHVMPREKKDAELWTASTSTLSNIVSNIHNTQPLVSPSCFLFCCTDAKCSLAAYKTSYTA